jgi:formylmethanofuran dehydrogenase subunit E
MEQLEEIPIKEYTKKLQEVYDKHGSHDYLQRHELVDMRGELEVLEKVVRTLREDIEAGIDQKKTHCGRCGEEFHELNEESNNSEGYCCYCAQVGK